ncbi:DUF4382 domain-containing protein [Halapricum desulfuricans]|uniref:DUF4382 family n=1 Tax=Halapricum desulfuricans TaxID=2841257 RepID=A0A897MWF4_9EURY|nr:DUF4382 domain-containing protein [Halapricum desulfuricans]QSG04601.1 DUF4382 family [Halapricum desulfuricans]
MKSSRRQSDSTNGSGGVKRRRFLLAGTAVGTALLSGCSGDPGAEGSGNDTDSPKGDTGTDSDDSTPEETSTDDGSDADTGTFRLLISDRPVAIDEFDSLDVSLDRARVFRSGQREADGSESDDGETATETQTVGNETGTTTEPRTVENETEAETVENGAETQSDDSGTETAAGDIDDDDGDDERGFFVLDLDGATVDLTQVVGDKATGVFEDDLPAGRYSKIELEAADVEGIVDGESVSVKIPSGKLQIVKAFEVTPGETVEFVFDITVVKKGNSGGYNLLPVISESGVAGRDVDVEEVGQGENGREDGDDEDDANGADTDEEVSQDENSRGNGDDGDGDDDGAEASEGTEVE